MGEDNRDGPTVQRLVFPWQVPPVDSPSAFSSQQQPFSQKTAAEVKREGSQSRAWGAEEGEDVGVNLTGLMDSGNVSVQTDTNRGQCG